MERVRIPSGNSSGPLVDAQALSDTPVVPGVLLGKSRSLGTDPALYRIPAVPGDRSLFLDGFGLHIRKKSINI